MKTARKLHFYLGMLFAPTIVFFAFSGALQILGLHEASGGEPAPAWIAKLAEIHKEQSIDPLPVRKAAPRPEPAADPKPEPARAERSGPHRSTALVVWCLALATSLLLSTMLGIYMAFAYKRDRIIITSLLGAGIALPVMFAFL